MSQSAKQQKDQQQQSQGFFKAKKQKALAEARLKEIESEESNIKLIIKDIILLQPKLETALFNRFLRIAQLMQANFLFRYKLLGATLQKEYTSRRVRMERLEKNFVQMESVYGKRMATFLRWKVTKEAKDQHQKWEKQIAEYKQQQDLEIENTELMMFLNTFNFSEAFLRSDDLISLTSLESASLMKRNRMGFDNVGMETWFQYIMNFREIINILVTKCQEIVLIVEPFVGPRFQKAHSDLIRGLLEGLVGLLNQRITSTKVAGALKTSNPKVADIMTRMVPIIVKEINKNLEKSLEMNLLELKVANIHAKYYTLIQNREKAYVLLFKAFKQMKSSLEKYVRVFTQYVRLFPILKEYLYDKKRLKEIEKVDHESVQKTRRPNSRISRIDLSSPQKNLETPKRPLSFDGRSNRSFFRKVIERNSQGSKHSISGRNIDPEIATKLSNVFLGVVEDIGHQNQEPRESQKMDSLQVFKEGFLSPRVPLVHLIYSLINKAGEENEDLSAKERKNVEEAHSLFLWRDIIKHRTKRTVFMQEYVAYFEKILSIDELMEIVETLGNSSMDSDAFPEAIGFFKTLIMLSEVHTKFQIVLNSISKEREVKEERLLQILALNKKIMVVYNKVARAYHMLGDQMSSYLYVVAAMFIYSNSLQMINDSDPLKYPKKNPNDFLTQEAQELEEATTVLKQKISGYVVNFNEHYRDTLSILESVGKVVETNFEKFGKDFFLAVKNCIQNIDRLQNFRKRTFMAFVGDIPEVHMQKWMKSKTIALLKEIHSVYVGMLEPLDIDQFVEVWIQIEVQRYLEQYPEKSIAQNLKPGKLNRTKVRFFYDFERQDIEWLQQAFTYAIFSAELRFVEQLELQSTIKKTKPPTNFADLVKQSSRRLLSGNRAGGGLFTSNFNFSGLNSLKPEGPTTANVPASNRSLVGQSSRQVDKPQIQKSLVGFHIPNLLTERIKQVETPQDLSTRIVNNLVRDQLLKIFRIIRNFKERRKKLKDIAQKAAQGELYLMRNTGGNKIKQRLERSEKHKDPDNLIGIYLRQQKSCETFSVVGNLVHHSRFFKEASKSISTTKSQTQLLDYREHPPTNTGGLFEDTTLPNGQHSFHSKYLSAVEKTDWTAGVSLRLRDRSFKHKHTKVSDSEEMGFHHSTSLTQKDNYSRQTTSNRAAAVRFADEEDSEQRSGLGGKYNKAGSNPLNRVVQGRGFLDILNLWNYTEYFYEEQHLRKVKNSGKKRTLIKKNTLGKEVLLDITHSNLTKTYSQGARKDETSKGTRTVVQLDDPDDQIVSTIEDSIPELCHARFRFLIPFYGIYEPIVITFEISLRKITLVLHFTKIMKTPIRTVLDLDLSEDLWILKEKFLLGKNPEMVRTYNPVVFDTLLNSFFLPTFKTPSHLNHIVPQDAHRLDLEQQLMGLTFPIALTRLSSYELDLMRKLNIFQEFTKADLDNLQALLKVVIYLARIIRSCTLNSPRGTLTLRRFNILHLVGTQPHLLSLFNTKHLLNYKVTKLNQNYDKATLHQLTFSMLRQQKNTLLDDFVTLENMITLLENLYFTVDFLRSFCRETSTPLRYGSQKKDFDMFVGRQMFQDEYTTFHCLDMSVKVVSSRLQHSTRNIKQLFRDSLPNSTKLFGVDGKKMTSHQIMILIFFLILENSFVFYLRIDSSFRETWLKVFSRSKGTIQKKLGKSDAQVSKLILEMPAPSLPKPEQAFISLSEFYHLHRSFETGIANLARIDQDTNFVLEDLAHNPTSLFAFLMKLTTSPFEQKMYVDFLEKVTAGINQEQAHLLQKSRSFYQVSSFGGETSLKANNFYYLRYDRLKEYTHYIRRPMKKLLEQFASNVSGPKAYSVKFFNTFVKLYSMAFETNDDSRSLKEIPDSREVQFAKLAGSKPKPLRMNDESPWEEIGTGQGLMQPAGMAASEASKAAITHITSQQGVNIMEALSGIVMTTATKNHSRHQQQLEDAFNENFREVMRTIPKTKTVDILALHFRVTRACTR